MAKKKGKPSGRSHRLNFMVPPECAADLEAAAEQCGMSQTDIIVMFLRHWPNGTAMPTFQEIKAQMQKWYGKGK